MKKLLKPIFAIAFALPTLAFANAATQTTTVDKVKAATGAHVAQAEVKDNTTTVISPRTGIRYTLGNTGGRPIILKTAAISAVVKRCRWCIRSLACITATMTSRCGVLAAKSL